jgi:glycogen debranching enzyme
LKSFNHLFWNENQHCLYDCIEGEHRDEAVRPNQIYAISLPFPLLKKEKAQQVFEIVTTHLLTPKGLRSLSSLHKDYKSSYSGDIWKRDGGYHQGTVWSFLIGPYIDSLIRVKGTNGRIDAARILNDFFEHLDEAGIGTISEIFDAEPPYAPRGCIAQAWGVAEAFRVAVEYDLFHDDR